MKKIFYLLITLIFISCGGGGGDDDGGGSPPPPPPTPDPPSAANLTSPENNKVCETGTSVSNTQSSVAFSWSASANTDTYDLKITNLNTNQVINSNNLSSINTTVTLEKANPYSWQVISKNSESTQTATSSTWKFYLAGSSETSFAPFPADLKSPKSGSTVARSSDGKVKLTWTGSDPDTSSGLKYTVYLDKTDGKQSPDDANKDLDSSELEISVDAGSIYYWRIMTSDGSNKSYSLVYSFRTE